MQDCLNPVIAEMKEMRTASVGKFKEITDVHGRVDDLETVAGMNDNALTGAKSRFSKLEDGLFQSTTALRGDISDFHRQVQSCKDLAATVEDQVKTLSCKYDLIVSSINIPC